MLPTEINPFDEKNVKISWQNGESYQLPYFELRAQCPCAHCVDEHTGERKLNRNRLQNEVKITHVELVGRYAVKVFFSDQHKTGIYGFDTLLNICKTYGSLLHQEEDSSHGTVS